MNFNDLGFDGKVFFRCRTAKLRFNIETIVEIVMRELLKLAIVTVMVM